MIEKILELLSALPRELYIFVISMLPIIELRGAVPVGALLDTPAVINYVVAVAGNMLPIPFILLFIPRILDFLERFKLFRPVVAWLKGKAQRGSEKMGVTEKNGQKICAAEAENDVPAVVCEQDLAAENDVPTVVCEQDLAVENGEEKSAEAEVEATVIPTRKMTRALFISLLLFVALPVPGTGAWSGSLVASLFGLPKKESFLAILFGVLICGVIMCLASYGVLGFLSFLI